MNEELRWRELLSSEKEQLIALGTELSIHPLAIEDCLHSNQRAKFEEFENHQLLVWFAFLEGEIYELEFLILPKVLVLVSNCPPPKGTSWQAYLQVHCNHKDMYHMLYQALDRTLDLSSQTARPLFDAIDEFEEQILSRDLDPAALIRVKRQLSQAEFALSGLSSVVAQWQRFLNPKDDLRWRLRDLWDHCERFHHALIFHRTQINSAMESYWGVSGQRTNDQIKKLSVLASIFVPLTFWTSFWGMNFTALPFEKKWVFWIAMGSMLGNVVITYLFLKRQGYWEKNR